MATPKKYGLANKCNPRLQMDLRWQKKQHQRNREKAPRVLVADKSTKEKTEGSV